MPAFPLRGRCPAGADEVWYAKRTLRRMPQKYILLSTLRLTLKVNWPETPREAGPGHPFKGKP
jgi:hypothetical protein